jgi:hypothetical protein
MYQLRYSREDFGRDWTSLCTVKEIIPVAKIGSAQVQERRF